jgi:hypothetical protein
MVKHGTPGIHLFLRLTAPSASPDMQHFILVSLGHSFHCALAADIFVAGSFRTLSASQAEQCQMVRWQLNDGLESISKEVGLDLSEVLSLHLLGRIEEANDKTHLA